MPETLADVLGHYVQRLHYSSGQLAALSRLPKRTIANWMEGRVKKPQRWQGLVKVAAVLHLDEAETSHLLQAAGHRSLADLRERAQAAEDVELLAPWPPANPPPFQPPKELPYFVGREKLLRELAEALLAGEVVNICNLKGMGGVGKTAIATRLAYDLQPHFPDGVLWAGLHSAEPMAVLSAFAGAYGQDVSQQNDLASRSSLVRGILANKRALIILDDAQSSAQVRPLLPPTTGHPAVIITTRHDLAVADGFKRFEIEPFSPDGGESLALFAEFLGQEYVRQHRASLLEMATLLGHLPLAIAIAAPRLAYTPDQTAADYLAQIHRQERRLDALIREDRGVRLSFDLSYRALSPDLQQFFAALGAFGGEDFGPVAVAAVTETPVETAEARLRELGRLSLVQPAAAARYSLHPLLQDYAREKIDQQGLFERMVDFYVAYAGQNEFDYEALDLETSNILAALQTGFDKKLTAALIRGTNVFYPFLEMRGLHDLAEHHLHQAFSVATTSDDANGTALLLTHLGHLAQKRADYAQAETHLQAGLSLVRQNAEPSILSRLLHQLAVLATEQGDYAQAEAYLLEGLSTARQNGDGKILGDILRGLAKAVAYSGGDTERVAAYLQESYTLAQQIGDQNGLIASLLRLGALAHEQGQWPQAEAYFQEGLTLARKIGNVEGELRHLHNLGNVAQSQGDFQQAENHFQEGVALAEKFDVREMVCATQTSLGEVAFEQEQLAKAEKHFQQALTVAREINHPADLSYVLANLGTIAIKQGHYAEAKAYLQEGLDLARETGQPWDRCTIFMGWGELHLAQNRFDEAETNFEQAITIAQDVGYQELLGEALYGLARARAAEGDLAEATRLGRESLAIFEEVGHHRQAEVKSWLDKKVGQSVNG